MLDLNNVQLSESAKSNIRFWIDEFGKDVEEEVSRLIRDGKFEELEDRFYRKLEFGTGGMRGKVAIGTNRMNEYNIRIATQGFANYLKKVKGNQNLSCVIGYDTRRDSRKFAIETSRVLVGNGIKVYLVKKPMPTPFISFAVRYLKASGGVIITASHNPPDYNGYKVYWDDGAQVVPPHDKGIIEEVYRIISSKEIKMVSDEELLKSDLFVEFLDEVKDAYLKILKVSLSELVDVEDVSFRKNIRIAYTPLHGTSLYLTIDALKYLGFENVYLVEEECSVDGSFSAVPSPNPEEDSSFERVIKLSKQVGAQVFFASDPDADRVRAGINANGETILFSGNQIASLMLEWILSKLHQRGTLPENGFVVTTIVTTDLIRKIAQSFNVETYLTLTGFKYIGEKIRQFEGQKRFIFGCEESIGYLYGDDARDKDSVISTVLISLMVEDLMKQGKSLKEYLFEIYRKYGVHLESLLSLEFEGVEGQRKIEAIMNRVRNEKFEKFAGLKVLSRIDIKNRTYEDLVRGTKEDYKTDLPVSNVIILNLDGGSRVIVRPSGTEPKVKIYFLSEFGRDVEKIEEYQRKHNLLVDDFKKKVID